MTQIVENRDCGYWHTVLEKDALSDLELLELFTHLSVCEGACAQVVNNHSELFKDTEKNVEWLKSYLSEEDQDNK